MKTPESPLIVGVGACAGGLEPVKSLLTLLPKDGGLSVVLVQNVGLETGDLLRELEQLNPNVAVTMVQDGRPIVANQFAVTPANRRVHLHDGKLMLTQSQGARLSAPIDHFFQSLAESQGARSIGVLLSGNGSDGTMGLKAIADAGGLSIAQTPVSAKFPRMPEVAASSGVVDRILNPDEIANDLVAYANHLRTLLDAPQAPLPDQIAAQLPSICDRLQRETGHDFGHYKRSTLVRRVQRRIQILKIPSADQYATRVLTDQEETQALFRELLIGVTSFFRDPLAFQTLADRVLPEIFQRKSSDDTIRIWVPGCASGQEAYSLAMLCREHMDEIDQPPRVKIFATDLDQQALKTAREGRYPVGVAAELSPARLNRYFVRQGESFQISKQLRQMVVFSPHNLISDPPFSKQDLISCRNLLIYLGPHLQKKLLPLFHYSLSAGGYLMLGSSENLSDHGELFRAIDQVHRISQRKETSITVHATVDMSPDQAARTPDRTFQPDLPLLMQRIALDEFTPQTAVVNQAGEIQCASPNIGRYVAVTGGTFQNNIVKMAREGIRSGLRGALREAIRTRRRIVHDNQTVQLADESLQRVTVHVQPMPQVGEDNGLYLIVFQDLGATPERAPHHAIQEGSAEALIEQLEGELSRTRHELEQSVQDLESSNEELESSNEELLAMNDELQLANEELESSKDEIQAGLKQLTRAKDDLGNLLRSTEIATLFLDDEFNIQSFTPAATEIFNLIDSDIGRPLWHQTHRALAMPRLPTPRELVDTDQPIEQVVLLDDGRSFNRRVLPYRTSDGDRQGIVVTFTDITELWDQESRMRLALGAARMDVVEMDVPSQQVRCFGDLSRQHGWPDEATSQEFFGRIHADDRAHLRAAIDGLSMSKRTFTCQYRVHSDAGWIWVEHTAEARLDQHGDPVRVVGVCGDITDRKQAEHELLDSRQQLELLANSLPALIAYVDADENYQFVNQAYAEVFGTPRDQIVGRKAADFLSDDAYRVAQPHVKAALRGELQTFELTMPANGQTKTYQVDYVPRESVTGEHIGFYVLVVDITAKIESEQRLRDSEEFLRRTLNTLFTFAGVCLPDGTLIEVNQVALDAGGLRAEDVLNRPFEETYWWSYDEDVQRQLRHAIDAAARGRPSRYDVDLRVADDEFMTMDFQIVPMRNADGVVTHLVPSAMDVSDRKRIETTQRQMAARLEAILSTAVDGIITIDRGGTINSVNPAVQEIFGYRQDELVGKSIGMLMPEPHQSEHRKYLEAYERTKTPRIIGTRQELEGVRKDGTNFPLELAVSETHLQDEHCYVGIVRDITHRHDAERSVRESEERLRLAVEAANFGSYDADLVSGKVYWSPRLKVLLGFAADADVSITATEIPDCIHPGDQERVRQELQESFDPAGDGHFHSEHRIVLADGTIRWLRYRGSTYFSTENRARRALRAAGTVLDITAQKRSEIALRAAEEKARLLLESTGEAIYGLDLDGNCVFSNPACARMLGYDSPDDLMGKNMHALIHHTKPDGSSYPRSQCHIYQTYLQGESIHVDDEVLWRADGTSFNAEYWAQPIYREDAIVGSVVTFLDITDRMRSREELIDARLAAEQANQAKSEFLANMSHEIRTPMTAILGFTDLLADELADTEDFALVQTIQENGQLLMQILNDILDLSKIESGMLEITIGPCSIADVVAEVATLMAARAQEKQLELRTKIADDFPDVVQTDGLRLKQILLNLVGNALKFTDSGSVTMDVRFLAAQSQVHIAVKDTGIGIAPEDQQKLFQPFTQADSSDTRQVGGTGLGLAISQRLAQLLGGQVTLASRLGQGSTFTVVLGVQTPTPHEDSGVTDSEDTRGELPQLNCHVLVVDDRREIRFLAQRLIESAGGQVTAVAHATAALEIIGDHAKNNGVDVVLTDIQMPEIDGYELTRQLRASGFERPIIALTAHARQEDFDRCLEAGCNAYASKPLDKRRLVRLIAEHTRRDQELSAGPKPAVTDPPQR